MPSAPSGIDGWDDDFAWPLEERLGAHNCSDDFNHFVAPEEPTYEVNDGTLHPTSWENIGPDLWPITSSVNTTSRYPHPRPIVPETICSYIFSEQAARPTNRTGCNVFSGPACESNDNGVTRGETQPRLGLCLNPTVPHIRKISNSDRILSISSEAPSRVESSSSSNFLSEMSRLSSATTPITTLQASATTPTEEPSLEQRPMRPRQIPRASFSTCTECSQSFQNRGSLERHQISHHHHGGFSCTKGCQKSFTLKKDRQRHESAIHERQTFHCRHCRYHGRKDNLRRHMRRHEGTSGCNTVIGSGRDSQHRKSRVLLGED